MTHNRKEYPETPEIITTGMEPELNDQAKQILRTHLKYLKNVMGLQNPTLSDVIIRMQELIDRPPLP